MRKLKYVFLTLILFSLATCGGGGGGGDGSSGASSSSGSADKTIYGAEITDPNSPFAIVAVDDKNNESIGLLTTKDENGDIVSVAGATYLNKDEDVGIIVLLNENGLPGVYVDQDGNQVVFSNYTEINVDLSFYDSSGNLLAGPITTTLGTTALEGARVAFPGVPSSRLTWKTISDKLKTGAKIAQWAPCVIAPVAGAIAVGTAATVAGVPVAVVAGYVSADATKACVSQLISTLILTVATGIAIPADYKFEEDAQVAGGCATGLVAGANSVTGLVLGGISCLLNSVAVIGDNIAKNTGGGDTTTGAVTTNGDAVGMVDTDGDGIADSSDNCPNIKNADQVDTDKDGQGDACDTDDDNDGVLDTNDNCPLVANANQADSDGNAIGDACEGDIDGDGITDGADNCKNTSNPDQADSDGDGIGNACEIDSDGDGVVDDNDNCVSVPNANQADSDGNGIGDACDTGVGGGVNNAPAMPSINVPSSVTQNQSVSVTVTRGSDPDSDQVKAQCTASGSNYASSPYNSSLSNGGTSATFSVTFNTAGTQTIWCATIDSNGGASSTTSVTITVNSSGGGGGVNPAPTASISSPSNGGSYTQGDSIYFSGSGTDTEDGNLSGGSLVWTSSINGQIGTGNSFSKSNLSEGTHVITLKATDSGGATGFSIVSIAVNSMSNGRITVGPSSLNFGSVNVGSCSTAYFAIQHVSGTLAASGSVSASSPFSISSGSSFYISNGQGTNVGVRFCPSSSGNFSGTATVSSSATFTGTSTVSLNGSGIGSSVPGSFSLSGYAYCNTSPPAAPAIMLNWSASSGATSYDLHRNGYLYGSGISGTNYDNNLNVTAGQAYSYYVMAKNSAGSTQSSIATVYVPVNVCP